MSHDNTSRIMLSSSWSIDAREDKWCAFEIPSVPTWRFHSDWFGFTLNLVKQSGLDNDFQTALTSKRSDGIDSIFPVTEFLLLLRKNKIDLLKKADIIAITIQSGNENTCINIDQCTIWVTLKSDWRKIQRIDKYRCSKINTHASTWLIQSWIMHKIETE